MPMTASYANIANQVWALIQTINTQNAGGSLTTYLGPAGTAVIGRHFPANWLSQITIATMSPVPAPNMADLVQRMGYANAQDFETACNQTSPNLWAVLQMFSQGQYFAGITYDDRIYISSHKKDMLDVILHELVHTLQWAQLGPGSFLRCYIRGFAGSYPNYEYNPAEVQAYGRENDFKNGAAGKNVVLNATIGAAIRGATDANGNPNASVAVGKLNTIQSLNITAASATHGMV